MIDMKKILIPALLLVAAFFTACNPDRLEIPQKGVVLTDVYYQTDEDCEGAMVAAYQGILYNVCTEEGASIYAPYRACFDLPGDDMYAAGSNYGDNDFMREMNEFTFGPNTAVLVNCYKNLFYAMYYSNIVIEKFGNGLPNGGQTPTTKRCVAEARVLRAWMQLMLTIGWGCPPLVDHLLEYDEELYRCDEDPNNPMDHNAMLLWCAKECETAMPDLPERDGPTDKAGAVKATKGFANAIAGKAYLFAGKYAEAKAALKKVIESGNYELVPTNRWVENFHANGDANEEKVFELNFENTSGLGWADITFRTTWMETNIWGWRADHFVSGGEGEVSNNPWTIMTMNDGWGGLGVPKYFADEFLANDGPNSVRFKESLIHIDDVVYNTHYGHAVDAMSLEEKQQSKAFGIKPAGLYGQSFYLAKKQAINPFVDGWYPGANQRFNNFVIMRYAEVLLMYAEACAQTGDNDGLQYLNAIQERAGSEHVSTALTLDEVKKEKKFELWLEMCRWPDMVRWGDLDKAAQAGSDVPVLYDKLFRAPQGGDQNVIWEHGSEANSRFYTVSTHEAKDNGLPVGYVAGKEYFPFPDISKRQNPQLNQLPYWGGGAE
jgi:hypothetical protein